MRAFIYTGGFVAADGITDHPEEGDLVIAADSGYKTAARLDVKVQIALGDFDSFPLEDVDRDVECITVPAEKDFTDTQMAVDLALSRGADFLFIIGGLSGRLDHTLSNLGILEDLEKRDVRAVLCDGINRVRLIRSTGELIPRSGYTYFSLLAADEVVKGVTVEGGKYPLKNATLRRSHQFAVSNEIAKNCALITVKKGRLFIIESRDPA